MAKVLIVEDFEKIVAIMNAYLKKAGHETLHITDGLDALDAIQSYRPDVILLDLMLPNINGEDLIVAIREKYKIPIIVLSAKTQEETVLESIKNGADDYLRKPYSMKELVVRIDSILRRYNEKVEKPSVLVFDNERYTIDFDRYLLIKDNEPIDLTKTEFKIISTLAGNPKHIYTRAQLLELLFGNDYDGYDRTLDVHIRNLRKKIEDVPNQPRLVKTQFGVGYYFGINY